MRLDEIVIVDYDPAWPSLFAEQRRRVTEAMAPWLVAPVEHIGSTSIPGLPAKPIIDMLALVDDYEATEAAIPAMAAIGWAHAPEPADAELRRWSFCFPDVARRSHHLHVVEERSEGWPSWLAFRDHLRARPDLSGRYAHLKRSLAARDPHDRPAYRAAKAPFITEVLTDLGF